MAGAKPGVQSSQVVTVAQQRRERWRNGAGWTREISAAREGDDPSAPWQWRVSIAEIDADAPFSSFPGIERELVLLSGNGLRLRFADGAVAELLPPHDSLRFAGEREVTGELLDGPTTDFNLMWRREAVAASLWRRPLVGQVVLFVDPGETWLVHLIGGDATFDGRSGLPPLQAGDTAVLRAGSGRTRFGLEGAGEALVIRIVPRPSPPASVAAGRGTASSH